MNFLSALLLSTAINIDTLKISFSSKNDSSVPLNFKKYFLLLIFIEPLIIFFLLFCFWKNNRLLYFYTISLSNIFGSVLLGFCRCLFILLNI